MQNYMKQKNYELWDQVWFLKDNYPEIYEEFNDSDIKLLVKFLRLNWQMSTNVLKTRVSEEIWPALISDWWLEIGNDEDLQHEKESLAEKTWGRDKKVSVIMSERWAKGLVEEEWNIPIVRRFYELQADRYRNTKGDKVYCPHMKFVEDQAEKNLKNAMDNYQI